jgi:hypothetical protein
MGDDYSGVPQYNLLGSLGGYGSRGSGFDMGSMGFSGQQSNYLSGGFGSDLSGAGGGFSLPQSTWGGMGGAGAAQGGGGLFGDTPFLSTGTQQGWGGMAMGGLGAAANLWMGMKQYGLAKKTLAENKRQFEMNYAAQSKLTNAQLEDRQRARVASNPGGYESVGSYMNRNGV